VGLVGRARKLLRSDGPKGLAFGLVRTVSQVIRRVYFEVDYCISDFDLRDWEWDSSRPPVEGLEVHVVESEADADQLALCGYEDFREVTPLAGRRLACGAVAFCAHVDRVLVHMAWVALDVDGKRTFDALPYAVDFANGEGCSGGSWTFPRYRRRGIYRHVFGWRLAYLQSQGCTLCRNATRTDNLPSRRGQGVFPHRVIGRAHLRMLFGRTRWTEYPSDRGDA